MAGVESGVRVLRAMYSSGFAWIRTLMLKDAHLPWSHVQNDDANRHLALSRDLGF